MPDGGIEAPIRGGRDPASNVADQAATLRRLFARPAVRVLPVLLPELHCATRATWIARLAEGFARQGERTLVIDAARAQIAATLGLRARFDLAHALRGECSVESALLDAGPNLTLVPAARAFATGPVDMHVLLAGLAPALAARGGCDLALVLVAPAQLARCAAADVLVPLRPESAQIARTLRDLDHASAAGQPRSSPAGAAVTPAFRLLFLGMDAAAAATLTQRLSDRLRALRRPTAVHFAGAVQVARDLAPVVRASYGWTLATMELMQ